MEILGNPREILKSYRKPRTSFARAPPSGATGGLDFSGGHPVLGHPLGARGTSATLWGRPRHPLGATLHALWGPERPRKEVTKLGFRLRITRILGFADSHLYQDFASIYGDSALIWIWLWSWIWSWIWIWLDLV